MRNCKGSFFIFFIFNLIFNSAYASNSLSTINSFGPGSSQINFVSVESAKTLDYKKFSFLGFLDSSYQSLSIYNSSQSGNDIISFTHLGLSYGLSPKLEIGIKGPAVFNQTADSSQSSIILTARGFVNIDGFVKYRLTDDIKSGLSLMGQVGVANGDELFFVGPGSGLNYSLSALYQKSLGRWLLATNLGYILRNPGNNTAGSLAFFEPIKSTITASVGLGRPITQSTRVSGEVLLASHSFTKDNSDRGSLSEEALLIFHTKVKSLNFSYGLGGGLTNGIATPTVRGFLGFQYPFGFPAQVAKKDESKEEEVAMAEPVTPREVAAEEPTILEPPVISENIAQENITELENEEVVDIKLTEEKIEEVINNDGLEPAKLSQKEFIIDDIVFIEEAKPEINEVVVVKEEEVVEIIAPEIKEDKIVAETIVPKVKEEVLETKNNQKIVLNNIEFDFDSAELNERSKQILDKVLNYISKNQYKTLEIWGHTDFYGPTVYNEYLGLRRSRAVYNYFKKSGISKRVMNFDAFGERRPVSLGIEEADRKKNRRVEILVIRN